MKKIKAFFDNNKNKEESKEEKENENTNATEDKGDFDYASAMSKMPKFVGVSTILLFRMEGYKLLYIYLKCFQSSINYTTIFNN